MGSLPWGLGDHLLGLGTACPGRHTHRAGRAPVAGMQRFPSCRAGAGPGTSTPRGQAPSPEGGPSPPRVHGPQGWAASLVLN